MRQPPNPLPVLPSDISKVATIPRSPLQDSQMALPTAQGARNPPTDTRGLSELSLFHKSGPQQSKAEFPCQRAGM